MEEFKFILFTERVFKNKEIFKLAHSYDFLCAIAYTLNETKEMTDNERLFIDRWKSLSGLIFEDLLKYDSSQNEHITLLDEYLSRMRTLLTLLDKTDFELVKQAKDFVLC